MRNYSYKPAAPTQSWAQSLFAETSHSFGTVARAAKAEHVFGVIKNIFGFRKVRYRGLAKNLHRLEVTAALANLYIVRRRLLRA